MRGVVLALAATAATASSVRIDDADPRWTFPLGWGAFTKTNPCTACAVKPDADRVSGGTWHDSSGDVSATLNVDAATAISVYTVCPGPLTGGGFYHLNVSFELDNAPAGEYIEKPTGCASTQYNYQIFSRTGLTLGPHKLVITNRLPSPEEQTSDLIIDYAIIDDGTGGSDGGSSSPTASQPNASQTPGDAKGQSRDDSSSGSSVPVAAIVVPILVVIALVAAVGFWWWRRRRQRTVNVDSLVATPYHDGEPGMRSMSNNAASSEVTHSFSPGPGTASLYSASVVPTHTPDADSSVLYIARNEQQAHDPQLEAALAIIADRAGRAQNPDAVSPAVAQSRRPEKAVYRPMPSVSTAGRSTSSTVTTSEARAGYMSPHDAAPPSYMDTVTR